MPSVISGASTLSYGKNERCKRCDRERLLFLKTLSVSALEFLEEMAYLEHLNFLSAVRAKDRLVPAVDLEDGLISVAMGVAAQLSIETGRFVTIAEVMDK
ncbi:hypothetical protein SDJN02_02914, partial [Cucurbita argyrosperma subsp. argyrosperma]